MRFRRWIAWIPSSLILLPLAVCAAGPWEAGARANVSHTYSDNLRLNRSGSEQGDHVTSASAGFSLTRQRTANQVSLVYDVVAVDYWDSEERDEVYQQFRGEGTLQVWRNHLFVDADAEYTQRIISGRDDVPLDLLTPSTNRADVAGYGGGARYQETYGRFAASEVSFRREWVDYQESGLDEFNSERDLLRAELHSGPVFTTFGWSVSYLEDRFDYDDGAEISFETLEGMLNWNLGRRLSVFGAAGRERNDFEFDPGRRPRPDDDFWRAGINWTGVRTSLTAYYGERFFGSTYGMSLTHRSPWATWAVEYTESPTTLSAVEFVPVLGLIELPTGELLLIELEIPELITEVYVSRRWNAGASGSTGRTQWSLRAYHEDREYQRTTALDQRLTGAALTGAWRVASRTRATTRLSWQRNYYLGDGEVSRLWALDLGLSRQLSRHVDTSVSVRHQRRDSTETLNDSRENRITLSVSARF
ncbi:MAG: TIGR03016 family PEP-CTERM system-associated outer membrane protein [Gammaproteobacteria bacterium]|nr:TIGR03016 family PEP-CTERM system-associated outer membrane protein [Gammaproteobacteria bacterium]